MEKQTNPTYLKAVTIREPSDIHTIKEDIKNGVILILGNFVFSTLGFVPLLRDRTLAKNLQLDLETSKTACNNLICFSDWLKTNSEDRVEEGRKIVEELYVIARDSGADIARLGEERIVVTPPRIKIWKPDYDLK